MGIHHFAYTFNSEAFHADLKRKIVSNDVLDVMQLQHLARSTMQGASAELKQILSDQRYDDDWLDDPDGDQSQAYLWYTILLSSVLVRSPSLSNNRYGLSWMVVQKVLPIVGWAEKEVNALVFGNFLKDFVDKPEYRAFSDNLSFYSGALNPTRIRMILKKLDANERYFVSPSVEVKQSITEITKYSELSPEKIIAMAYEDARDMLRAAVERGESLYLVSYW